MKLFVANISRECPENELKEAFSTCGEVKSIKIIKDRDTGESRGFGFVEMENSQEGEKAIAELNDKHFYGRPIIVKKAREQERRFSKGRREGRREGR